MVQRSFVHHQVSFYALHFAATSKCGPRSVQCQPFFCFCFCFIKTRALEPRHTNERTPYLVHDGATTTNCTTVGILKKSSLPVPNNNHG